MLGTLAVVLFVLLFTKHFIFDFLVQGPFQYENKGKYFHFGGILHSGLHAVGTFLAFCAVFKVSAILVHLMLIDFLVHYHIDWLKVKLNTWLELNPDNKKFWWLLGLDQYLHYLTYAGLVLVMINLV